MESLPDPHERHECHEWVTALKEVHDRSLGLELPSWGEMLSPGRWRLLGWLRWGNYAPQSSPLL